MEQEHPAIVDLLRRVRVGNGQQRLTEAGARIHALRARIDGVAACADHHPSSRPTARPPGQRTTGE